MQLPSPRPKKLLNQVRDAIRAKHYSYCTEETYVQWIRRYILFHNKCHPCEMGVPEIEAFLTHLAVETQRWSPCAVPILVCRYRDVHQMALG